MVAYGFQRRFVEPILAGTKGGTIRAPRRQPRRGQFQFAAARPGGHARPDEDIQLYVGMRTSRCRLITRKRCLVTERIRLAFIPERIYFRNRVTGEEEFVVEDDELDVFARFDGFADYTAMADFWRATHGDPNFDGWHIRWLPLPDLWRDA